MALTTAWAVDGSQAPASVGRMVAWCASNGATGIVQAGDLKVSALATPGGAVNIAPGGALMSDGYPSQAKGQTYATLNDATAQLTIPATGSGGGRTDYVILRIDDWNETGQTPADPTTAPGCSFQRVSSISNLTYPFVALAKIAIPASTGTITGAMITDLRQVANPRTKDIVISAPGVASDQDQTLNVVGGTGEIFPAARIAMQTVDVPTWATRIQIMSTAVCINYAAGTNPYGDYWVEWGDTVGSSVKENVSDKYHFDSPGGSNMTISWPMATDQYVPAKYRGTTTSMWFKARYSASGMAGSVKGTASSGMIWHIRFLEVADNG